MPAKPFTFILFGATGDLAVNKLLPALSALHARNGLAACLKILAVSRRPWPDGTSVRGSSVALNERTIPLQIDLDSPDGYQILAKHTEGEPVVYVSLAPDHHMKVIEGLRGAGIIAKGKGKVLIEKPFGTDEKSAKELNARLLAFLDEDQIYRIDHYLGKATVRAMMGLHTGAPDWRHLVSRETVAFIEVRFDETIGVNGRGASYDGVGAFRDVAQNHMLEMLAVLAAESADAEGRTQVVLDIMPASKTCEFSRRGQYRGYTDEVAVAKNSQTETAFEVSLSFQGGRLKGVPVVLRGGKRMQKGEVYVRVMFKDSVESLSRIDFSVRPTEEIRIVYKDAHSDVFAIADGQDAYEHVIADAIAEKKASFVGAEEAEALWRYADQVVACWNVVPLEPYDKELSF